MGVSFKPCPRAHNAGTGGHGAGRQELGSLDLLTGLYAPTGAIPDRRAGTWPRCNLPQLAAAAGGGDQDIVFCFNASLAEKHRLRLRLPRGRCAGRAARPKAAGSSPNCRRASTRWWGSRGYRLSGRQRPAHQTWRGKSCATRSC